MFDADFTIEAGELFVIIKLDRKSTRLNSSHSMISYAVFCLKKKNNALAFARCGEIGRGHV